MATSSGKRLITSKDKIGTIFLANVALVNVLLCVCLADVSDTSLPNGTCLCFNSNNTDLLTAGKAYKALN